MRQEVETKLSGGCWPAYRYALLVMHADIALDYNF